MSEIQARPPRKSTFSGKGLLSLVVSLILSIAIITGAHFLMTAVENNILEIFLLIGFYFVAALLSCIVRWLVGIVSMIDLLIFLMFEICYVIACFPHVVNFWESM